MRQLRKPRKPRQPREPRGGRVPSERCRVASVTATGDWPVLAMVEIEIAGFGTINACSIGEVKGRLRLAVLRRDVERPHGGLQEVPMIEFASARVKLELELEALAMFAALKSPAGNATFMGDSSAPGREREA